jgi:hypothetical protein
MIKKYSENRLLLIAFAISGGCLVLYLIPFIVISFMGQKKYYMPVEFPDFFVL